MTAKEYITVESAEKNKLQRAKKVDPRFAEPSRITDGAYLALLAQEAVEQFEGDE